MPEFWLVSTTKATATTQLRNEAFLHLTQSPNLFDDRKIGAEYPRLQYLVVIDVSEKIFLQNAGSSMTVVVVQLQRPWSQSFTCWWRRQQHTWNSSSSSSSCILYRDNCWPPQLQRKHTTTPTLYSGTPAAASPWCFRYYGTLLSGSSSSSSSTARRMVQQRSKTVAFRTIPLARTGSCRTVVADSSAATGRRWHAGLCVSRRDTAPLAAAVAAAVAAAAARRCGRRRRAMSDAPTVKPSLEIWNQTVSRRDWADLEDQVCTAVARSVVDPVLHVPLDRLQWLVRRIGTVTSAEHESHFTTTVSSSFHHDHVEHVTLQLLLRPPSLLHPALEELKELVRLQASAEIQAWLEHKKYGRSFRINVNVQAVPSNRPVPMMARLVHDKEELLESLGPGLQSVAHYLAVYSCKVNTLQP
jgi:hypothetical protein